MPGEVRASPPASCKVYTPLPLAEAMVWALGDESGLAWLEPSVGEGVFLTVLGRLGVEAERITAIDLDVEPRPEDEKAKTTRGQDFLKWAVGSELRFDRVVGNPPFISLSKLGTELRETALGVKSPKGEGVALGSNYWCAFLYACLRLLRPGASLGFVLPASWDYADYAQGLKSQINHDFGRVEIYRSRRPLFASVQDGSIVLLAFGFGSSNSDFRRFEFDSAAELTSAMLDRAAIDSRKSAGVPYITSESNASCRLGDVMDIKLGGVTGAADYFLLTEEQRSRLRLPVGSLRPVLSKARHLTGSEITRDDWQQLRDSGHRIWLFDPGPAHLQHTAVKEYLDSASSNGEPVKQRYKVRSREPWYITPVPVICHGFVSGMSSHGPWICLNMARQLTATNTLYAVTFRQRYSLEERFAWALSMMTTKSRRSLTRLGRVYPDGLLKYEPGDLSDLPIRRPKRVRGAREVYRQVVHLFLAGDLDRACQLADGFGWE